MSQRSNHFTHAVTRQPCNAIIDGLRAVDTGAPDLAVFRHHHGAYIEVLKSTGAVVTELPAMEAFPDSVFIEDAALCLQEAAIIMRPGAATRLGEAAAVRPVLESLYNQVFVIDGPGFIEGGDILVTESEILVGRSARTDAAGVAELRAIVPVRIRHSGRAPFETPFVPIGLGAVDLNAARGALVARPRSFQTVGDGLAERRREPLAWGTSA